MDIGYFIFNKNNYNTLKYGVEVNEKLRIIGFIFFVLNCLIIKCIYGLISKIIMIIFI